jgi:hypothetical protein
VLISPDRPHALPQTVIIIPNQRWHEHGQLKPSTPSFDAAQATPGNPKMRYRYERRDSTITRADAQCLALTSLEFAPESGGL